MTMLSSNGERIEDLHQQMQSQSTGLAELRKISRNARSFRASRTRTVSSARSCADDLESIPLLEDCEPTYLDDILRSKPYQNALGASEPDNKAGEQALDLSKVGALGVIEVDGSTEALLKRISSKRGPDGTEDTTQRGPSNATQIEGITISEQQTKEIPPVLESLESNGPLTVSGGKEVTTNLILRRTYISRSSVSADAGDLSPVNQTGRGQRKDLRRKRLREACKNGN